MDVRTGFAAVEAKGSVVEQVAEPARPAAFGCTAHVYEESGHRVVGETEVVHFEYLPDKLRSGDRGDRVALAPYVGDELCRACNGVLRKREKGYARDSRRVESDAAKLAWIGELDRRVRGDASAEGMSRNDYP